MHAPYPGQIVITDDNRGPVANLGAWLTMCCMILFVICKIVTKVLCIGSLQKDDLFICISMIFGVAQVATVSMQVRSGLGKHTPVVDDMSKLQQATLVSEVLYVVALCFAQVAILQYMLFLSRDTRHRSTARVASIFTVLWAIASFFSVVFQCKPSSTSAVFGDKCFDQTAFWAAWTVTSAILDVTIGLLPVLVIYKIHVRRSVKAGILFAFGSRMLAIPLSITRLVYIYRVRNRDDLSYSMLDVALFTTVHMNVSIILTCVPFLKPVLDGLQSGIWAGELRSNSLSHAFTSVTSSMQRKSKKHPYSNVTGVSEKRRGSSSRAMRKHNSNSIVADELRSYAAHVETGMAVSDGDGVDGNQNHKNNNHQHQCSADSVNPMLINQTTTITVERDSSIVTDEDLKE